jgi:hypothetical protein
VFDGAHLGAVALEARAHARVADEQGRRRQVKHGVEINASKDDAGAGAAGRKLMFTLTPEWRPTPAARTTALSVRCFNMCLKKWGIGGF